MTPREMLNSLDNSGYSMVYVSKETGIANSALYKILNGGNKRVRRSTADKIERLYLAVAKRKEELLRASTIINS